MHLGIISHPDPNTDSKVKYFQDYFHYWLQESAWKLDGFPSSHLSLLQRIEFRLKHVQALKQSTYEVIKIYLNNPLFNLKKDPVCKERIEFQNKLRYLKYAFEHKKYTQIDLALCRNFVNDLIIELNGGQGLKDSLYFKIILEEVVSFLKCAHPLPEHSMLISYYAKLISAEYMRVGFDAKDLQSIDGAFHRMLSKSRYSSNTDKFSAQFNKLLQIYLEEKYEKFIIRIDNIKASKNFKFKYDAVVLTNFNLLKIDTCRWDSHYLEKFEEYFNVENSIVAVLSFRYKSYQEAKRKVLLKVRQALGALQYQTKKMNPVINQDTFYRIKGKHMGVNWHSSLLVLQPFSIDRLKKDKFVIPLPKTSNNDLLQKIKESDKIFFRALSDEYLEDAIVHFWRYWENVFSSAEYKGDAPKIIEHLAIILSKNQFYRNHDTLAVFLFDCTINTVMNSNPPLINLSYTFCAGVKHTQKGYRDFIKILATSTQYPFLKKFIARCSKMTPESEFKKGIQFYKLILWELYEQRNFIMHDGNYCPQTLEQIYFYIQRIITQWRTTLFNEIEKGPHNEMEDLIRNLVLNKNGLGRWHTS